MKTFQVLDVGGQAYPVAELGKVPLWPSSDWLMTGAVPPRGADVDVVAFAFADDAVALAASAVFAASAVIAAVAAVAVDDDVAAVEVPTAALLIKCVVEREECC